MSPAPIDRRGAFSALVQAASPGVHVVITFDVSSAEDAIQIHRLHGLQESGTVVRGNVRETYKSFERLRAGCCTKGKDHLLVGCAVCRHAEEPDVVMMHHLC